MTVEYAFTENKDILLIKIKGMFDFSMLSGFREAYSCDINNKTKVIIDLRETSSINSSALGMLLNMQRHLDRADGDIDIINCNQVVKKVFSITHFDKKFKIE